MTQSASGPYPIRPIEEDELDGFMNVDEHAFNTSPWSEGDRRVALDRFEFDRTLVAFDGSNPVGGTVAFTFQLRVPGATVPAAGVSWVSVLPNYRRQGILRSLMNRQLADVHNRGEALAVLWASESVLYGRYGYGQASWNLAYTIRRGEGALAADAPSDPALRLRITEPAQVRAELAKVHEDAFETRPGFFRRDELWWDRYLWDPESARKGASPLRCVLAEDDAGPRGYSLYSGRGDWDEDSFLPTGTINVRELVATDPAGNESSHHDLSFAIVPAH